MILWIIAAAALIGLGDAPPAAAQGTSTVIFAATAEPGNFCKTNCTGAAAHYGFNLSCTTSRSGPGGSSSGSCSGSMYFLNILGRNVPVSGTVELSGNTATITAGSATTAPKFIACQLTNLTLNQGPKNIVEVVCKNTSEMPGPDGSAQTRPDAIVEIMD
jgi:hypothetical protein